jgi:hypothetical protein
MPVPQLNRRLLPFFIGVPLAWAVVLIFHPARTLITFTGACRTR